MTRRTASTILPPNFLGGIYERQAFFTELAPDQRPPFSRQDAERVLFSTLHRAEDIDLLRRGSSVKDALELRPDNYVSPKGLQDALREGSSVRLRSVCRLNPDLADWIAELGSVFSAATEANLYVTAGAEPALKPHQDGHDVFAYQINGAKTWFVAPPEEHHVSLPMERQASDKVEPPKAYTPYELTPGAMLYMPRGFIHHTEWRGGVSMHLAFRIEPVRWYDLLASMAEHAALDREALRVSVASIGGVEQRDRIEALSEAFGDRQAVRLAYAKALSNKRAFQDANRASWETVSLAALERELSQVRNLSPTPSDALEPAS